MESWLLLHVNKLVFRMTNAYAYEITVGQECCCMRMVLRMISGIWLLLLYEWMNCGVQFLLHTLWVCVWYGGYDCCYVEWMGDSGCCCMRVYCVFCLLHVYYCMKDFDLMHLVACLRTSNWTGYNDLFLCEGMVIYVL